MSLKISLCQIKHCHKSLNQSKLLNIPSYLKSNLNLLNHSSSHSTNSPMTCEWSAPACRWSSSWLLISVIKILSWTLLGSSSGIIFFCTNNQMDNWIEILYILAHQDKPKHVFDETSSLIWLEFCDYTCCLCTTEFWTTQDTCNYLIASRDLYFWGILLAMSLDAILHMTQILIIIKLFFFK